MCTTIRILSEEKEVFWGRTMDFTFDPFSVDSKIAVIPKGYEVKGQYQSWKSNYQFFGINMADSLFFYDGINEAGLVGDAQYLEECSWATEAELKNRNLTPLIGEEIVAWVLSHYATVDEIAADITNYGLLKTTFEPWEKANTGIPGPVPCHYSFTDASGRSIVIEPTENGAFRYFMDTIGVMTNSPTYDWHMTNLRNYVGLSDTNRGRRQISEDLLIQQIESGSGLLGMPGDYTAPSRFIRGTFLSKFVDAFSSEAGINQLYKIFQAVIVPKGIEKMKAGEMTSDYTGYWSGYDVSCQEVFVQPYDCASFTTFSMKDKVFEDYTTFEISRELVTTRVGE